jgi:glyoxylase-like metal-dependent hydrolase (beta-lactamase superfamily II)
MINNDDLPGWLARGGCPVLRKTGTECDNTVLRHRVQRGVRRALPAGQVMRRAMGVARALASLTLGLMSTVLLAACAGTASMPTNGSAAPGRAIQVAPGVYMMAGQAGEVDPVNLGRVGNAGFVVGPQGVVAIDSGTSAAQGEAMLAEIARVTDQPVRLLLLTHTRQEFLFGAQAFHRRGIPIHMHRAAAQLMAARCETCLKTLKRILGSEAMAGTEVPRADVVFDGDVKLDVIGRPLWLLQFGLSSGPGHVALLDEQTRVLFAGGLLDAGRIPDVQDGQLAGWHSALEHLRRLATQGAIRRIVPGHGPVSELGLIDVVARYLTALDARTLALLQTGAALSEVGDACELPEFAGWDQYDTIHRRNASMLFLKHERAQMLQ